MAPLADKPPAKTFEAQYWYLYLLAGALMVAMGVWVLRTPLESYVALAFAFSLTFLASGVAEIFFALANMDHRGGKGGGWGLLGGIFNALVGLLLLANPALSMITLPIYIGVAVMFRSVMALSWALSVGGLLGSARLWITVLAILGVLFAFVLLWNPAIAGLTAMAWTALAIVSYGAAQIFLAFQLRNFQA